jgi:hypothetical protein
MKRCEEERKRRCFCHPKPVAALSMNEALISDDRERSEQFYLLWPPSEVLTARLFRSGLMAHMWKLSLGHDSLGFYDCCHHTAEGGLRHSWDSPSLAPLS